MMTLPLRFLFVVVSSIAYLALAILGWGGVIAFFSHPALVALTVVFFILVAVAFFAGGNVSSGTCEDRSNRWVLVAFGIIGLLDGFLPALTDRRGIWTLDGDAIRWLGVMPPLAGRCDSGQCSSLARASAGSWQSNPGTHWSRTAFTVSSGTRVIWGYS